jgi:transcriptional regulator with XRE-family HTH domain
MNIGDRLREQRKRVGLTLGQVAEYEDLSKSYLSDLERGVNNPPVWPLLVRLARRYKTTTDYLLGVSTNPSPRRDEPLPDQVREVVELLLGMTPQRQHDVLAMVQALASVDDQAADHLQTYDRMMELIEAAGGEDAVAALETALRAGAAGDTAAALRLIEAFFAGRDAKETLEEERDEV